MYFFSTKKLVLLPLLVKDPDRKMLKLLTFDNLLAE